MLCVTLVAVVVSIVLCVRMRRLRKRINDQGNMSICAFFGIARNVI